MRSGLSTIGVVGAGCLVLAGCGTIRHDNVMVFGTDTNFGITAGPSTTNVAEVSVGYRRQEAVVLPLVANKADQNGNLIPCEIATSDQKPSECKLVANYGNDSRDSYSVLASFGAKFSAENGNGNPNASGGLAQYFATGVAAQVLALRGGAALVATGEAAQKSAEKDVVTPLGTILGSPEAEAGKTKVLGRWMVRRTSLSQKLLGMSDSDLAAYVPKVSGEAYRGADGKPTETFVKDRCDAAKIASLHACLEKVQSGELLDGQTIDELYEADERLTAAAAKLKGGQ